MSWLKKSVAFLLFVAPFAYGQNNPSSNLPPTSASESAAGFIRLGPGAAGSSFATVSGFGARQGSVGLGLFFQEADSTNTDYDGSAGLSVGLGDPEKWVGLDLSLALSSLSRSEGSPDGFGEAGAFGAKIHRRLPFATSIAIGVSGFGRFGSARDANSTTTYGAISSRIVGWQTGEAVDATVGVGNRDLDADGSGASVFGSLAVHVNSRLSLITEYTGRYANVAVSFAPMGSQPLTVTLGATNLNDRFDLGTRAALSIGYGFSISP
jgi:hypothetical protein